MTHYSRSQLAQITKRAKLAEFKFDPQWKCLICGTKFSRCHLHTEEDNLEVLELVK